MMGVLYNHHSQYMDHLSFQTYNSFLHKKTSYIVTRGKERDLHLTLWTFEIYRIAQCLNVAFSLFLYKLGYCNTSFCLQAKAIR